MFAAPPEQSLEWSDSGVEGAYRFLKRVWTFAATWAEAISQFLILCADNKRLSTIDYNVITKNARRQITRNIAPN